jgi:endogenous inhibitor of DNA gyrase (YacG/DUF329 family)
MRLINAEEKMRRQQWQRNCGVCGTVFGWSKNGDKAKFCSRVCAGKNNGSIGTNRGKLNHYVCALCQKPFSVYYKNRKFCSFECSAKGKEMPPGYACKVDENHKEIVDAMKAVGASIIDTSRLGQGMPDLIVGFRGQTILLEIKNPKTQYGRKGLNANQRKWAEGWTGGPLSIVDSVDAALRVLGVMK